jgi:hypothetical protein
MGKVGRRVEVCRYSAWPRGVGRCMDLLLAWEAVDPRSFSGGSAGELAWVLLCGLVRPSRN